MEEVYFSTLMGIHMKGIGLMGRNKEKVSMYMQMVTTTKANGNSTNATAPAWWHLATKINTMVAGTKARKAVQENIS